LRKGSANSGAADSLLSQVDGRAAMITGMRAQRIIQAGRLLCSALLSPTTAWPSKLVLVAGLSYLFVPLDLIPDRIPILGHVDEAGAVLSGLIFSYLLIPPKFQERGFIAATDRPSSGGTPNFFIVGAARCGTTSLFEALTQHPDVFGCPIKEPNYFTFPDGERDAARAAARRERMLIERGMSRLLAPPLVALVSGYDAYLDLFRGWRGQRAVGEASTSYLPSPVAARAIASYCPDARIIIILRDPVARAYSDFLMLRQIGHEWESFEAAVEHELQTIRNGQPSGRGVVRSSCYADQIRRYLEHFPRTQLLFVMFDELVHEPEATLQRVFRHLRVDPEAGKHIRITWQNKSRSVRVGWLSRALVRNGMKWILLRAVPKAIRRRLGRIYYAPDRPPALSITERERLLEMFRDDIRQTGALINRDLSHWAEALPQ
jgi:hypothetical protein